MSGFDLKLLRAYTKICSGTLLTAFNKLFSFIGSHTSQSSYSFLFQVFDNLLLDLLKSDETESRRVVAAEPTGLELVAYLVFTRRFFCKP